MRLSPTPSSIESLPSTANARAPGEPRGMAAWLMQQALLHRCRYAGFLLADTDSTPKWFPKSFVREVRAGPACTS